MDTPSKARTHWRRSFTAVLIENPTPRYGSLDEAHRAALPYWLALLEAARQRDEAERASA